MTGSSGSSVKFYETELKEAHDKYVALITAPQKDIPAIVETREMMVREQKIHFEKIKHVRRALADCYKRHGVNHLAQCKQLREEYGSYILHPTQVQITAPQDLPPNKKK